MLERVAQTKYCCLNFSERVNLDGKKEKNTRQQIEAMEDLLYPKNHKREARVSELATDIGSLLNELSKDAHEIKSLLEKLNTKLREMYRSIKVDIPPGKFKKFEYKGWITEVISGLEILIFFKPVEMALQDAAVMSLRAAGSIGEAAFYDSLSIGLDSLTWIKFGVEVGAVVAVVALDFGIAAIAGDVKKSKLRHAIHSSIKPRIELKKASIINGRLREKLETVVGICDTMVELGYTEEQLDQKQAKVADEFKEEVSKITEETAKQALAHLDKHRGSWTKEDHHH